MQNSFAMKTALAIALACVIGLAAVLAMRGQQTPATPALGSSPSAAAASPVAGAAAVAEVDGETITADQVDKALGPALDKLEQQIYDMRREQLDQLISERLVKREAERRGVTVEALLAAEVGQKVTPVTDADVEQFFQANKERLPQQPEIRPQIQAVPAEPAGGRAARRLLQVVARRGEGCRHAGAPPVTRVTIDIAGAPFKGPENAPVTLVEFSDFHCPFCRRVKPTLAELLARYPDKIKLVYKDLPLDSLHPAARSAAEAARCAHDQGKFWPFHDKVYERAPDASPATLKAIATEVGLDLGAFDECVATGRHRDTVRRSVAEAEGFGATGTPAFFVNGRLVAGALPLEQFTRVIDEELAGTVRSR